MKREGIDGMMILGLESYCYFTGDIRKQPRLMVPAVGQPRVIVFESEADEVRKSTWIEEIITYRALHEMMAGVINFISSLGVENPKIGFEFEFSTPAFLIQRFEIANPNVEIVDAKPVISELRKIKEDVEVEAIKKASEIADLGMKIALETTKPGVTELEVATEIEYKMKKAGAERVAFPIFVNSGYRSLWLHGLATHKKIEEGDLVLIDIGPVYNGYCADLCRTFSVGKTSHNKKRLYEAYLALQKRVIDSIKPEVKIFELEQIAQEEAEKVGFGEFYVRGFLHGIGLGFEETPFPTIFPEDIMEPLLPKMTISVGHSVLSVPEIGGVRTEDTGIVTEDGFVAFTKFPKDLQEV